MTNRPRASRLPHALAGVAISLALAGCDREPGASLPAAGVIELSEAFSGDYALTDFNGGPRSDEDFAGRVAIIYFGFASCPDVCPLALGRLSAALNELGANDLSQIAPIFISVDPNRDTPQALKKFLAFDDRILGLTGDAESISNAKRAFKVFSAEEPLEGSALDYTVQHSSLFYLVDREGHPRVALQDALTAPEIAAALRDALAWR